MSEELRLKETAARAERAERIMSDPLVKGALENMRDTLYHNIETSIWRARGEREEAYRMLKLIKRFEADFEAHMRDGKVARSRLDELKRKLMR